MGDATTKMKAAIYNPYWDTLGGGERYTASVVKVLLEEGYEVHVQWREEDLVNKIKSRFDIDIKRAEIVKDVNRGDGYDLCFWVSDGSIPTLKSRNNILHFQIPFRDVNDNVLLNRMKLFRITHVVCNSQFTKNIIDGEYKINSKVLYPPVDVKKIRSKRKENLIIYIGRFSELAQAKGQEVLVEVFKKVYDSGHKNWKLVLAGGTEVGENKLVKKLRKQAKGYPVRIIESPSFKFLLELYGKSKIFWSASGYRVDEQKEPLKVEHFGMTVVEAMAAGSVPIVTKIGGHTEIIDEGENGLTFQTKKQLIKKTTHLIENQKELREISKNAKIRAKDFSFEKFRNNLLELI